MVQRTKLKISRISVALVAAYMLILQGLFGAFALGAAAALPMLDAFGNPLCITSSDPTASDTDDTSHSAVPDCCTVACSMFTSVATDERPAASVFNPLAATDASLAPRIDLVAQLLSPKQNPGSPRSPPQAVA